jgi:hypothetical protein
MMMEHQQLTWIRHKFLDHRIDPNTETLIIGTFNPDTKNNIDCNFFYSRPKNHLWTILPEAFGEKSLKGKPKEEKIKFMQGKHIDFIDLISEIAGEPPQDFKDNFLDRLPETHIRWRNVLSEIDKLCLLRRVGVSRKGFADVPKIGNRVGKIRDHLRNKPIFFQCLNTPSQIGRARPEWRRFLHSSWGGDSAEGE